MGRKLRSSQRRGKGARYTVMWVKSIERVSLKKQKKDVKDRRVKKTQANKSTKTKKKTNRDNSVQQKTLNTWWV